MLKIHSLPPKCGLGSGKSTEPDPVNAWAHFSLYTTNTVIYTNWWACAPTTLSLVYCLRRGAQAARFSSLLHYIKFKRSISVHAIFPSRKCVYMFLLFLPRGFGEKIFFIMYCVLLIVSNFYHHICLFEPYFKVFARISLNGNTAVIVCSP